MLIIYYTTAANNYNNSGSLFEYERSKISVKSKKNKHKTLVIQQQRQTLQCDVKLQYLTTYTKKP